MSNVIFNLADTTGGDIISAKQNLQLRSSKLTIHSYELWELLVDDTITGLKKTGTDERVTFAEIQKQCNSASKIIISTHGPLNSSDYGVLKDAANALPAAPAAAAVPNVTGKSLQITLDQVSSLFGRFILPNRKYYIATLICYAARTSDHRANHGVAGVLDWSDSFACKLFAKLCENRTAKLTMSARTGQHGFSSTTGLSEVQTEDAVQAEIAVSEDTDRDALLAWVKDTKEFAFDIKGPPAVVRDDNNKAFALDYFTAEAMAFTPADKIRLLTQKMTTALARAMTRDDYKQFSEYLKRMRQDNDKTQVASHNGKIYYYFDPKKQEINIKRDNRNSIGWHSKTDLQTSKLAAVLGTS